MYVFELAYDGLDPLIVLIIERYAACTFVMIACTCDGYIYVFDAHALDTYCNRAHHHGSVFAK